MSQCCDKLDVAIHTTGKVQGWKTERKISKDENLLFKINQMQGFEI